MKMTTVLLFPLLAALVSLCFGCSPRTSAGKKDVLRLEILLPTLEREGCSAFIQSYQETFSTIENANRNSTSNQNFGPIQKITYMTLHQNGSENETKTVDVPLALEMILRKEFMLNQNRNQNQNENQHSTSVEAILAEQSNWTLTQILPQELGGPFEWYNLALKSPGTKRKLTSHHKLPAFSWKSIDAQILDHLNSNPAKEIEYDVVLVYNNSISFPQPPTDFLICVRFPGTEKQEIVQHFDNHHDNQDKNNNNVQI